MSIKQFYKAPLCAYERKEIDVLICESNFDGSVTEDLTITDEFQW